MGIRTLTNEEYLKLAQEVAGKGAGMNEAQRCKQVHRLLCEGRQPKELVPAEQLYVPAFGDLVLVQIPNDYGWEPGIEEAEAPVEEPKPKKQKRSE